ncbi:hypothetical protein POTOM_040975 [Populus tomentosa]|uniref:NAD(+) kinase n=1 Tax=Populus tomentosa TaxID=118781 RepID=A0A8X7YQ20_POPTO|nr:hypothetical protein POTOM_040972 [Populus tomentosa]KAG6755159.1 hypothetical protein POTOM_040975 [Populus tomentosa]
MSSEAFRCLDNRRKVHKDAINYCQDILRKKSNIDWEPILRTNLSQPIRSFDLVVTVGGDGTLLQASHFLDDSIPVLGVNSDPTQVKEVSLFVRLSLDLCSLCLWRNSVMNLMLLEALATCVQQLSRVLNKKYRRGLRREIKEAGIDNKCDSDNV